MRKGKPRMLRNLALLAVATALATNAIAAPGPAQPFEVVAFDGRRVSLESLRGNAAVLMFFSTECPHCQQTSVQVDPIYRELQKSGFKMIGLSLNATDEAGLRNFAARFQASFPLALSSREQFSRITGTSVMTRIYYPYLVFLDKDGIIREEHQGSEQAWFDSFEANFRKIVEPLLQ